MGWAPVFCSRETSSSPALACRVVKPNFELSYKLMFEREIVNRHHGMARRRVHCASVTAGPHGHRGRHPFVYKAMELEQHHGPKARNDCTLRRRNPIGG